VDFYILANPSSCSVLSDWLSRLVKSKSFDLCPWSLHVSAQWTMQHYRLITLFVQYRLPATGSKSTGIPCQQWAINDSRTPKPNSNPDTKP